MHVLLVNISVDLTGASRSSLVDSDSTSLPDFDRQLMMGVTSDEIDMLKQTANSAIHDSLLKKIQEIDQVSLAFTVILISLLFLIETIQKYCIFHFSVESLKWLLAIFHRLSIFYQFLVFLCLHFYG